MRFNTTNRPCEAVGVEEINGLVQNAKGFVVRNARWAVYKCQMVRDTKRQRARVRNARWARSRNAKWAVYKCQMLLMQMPINSLYE